MLQILSSSVFYEIAAILVLAATLGLLSQWLRQPLITGFIAVGVLVGPSLLGLVQSQDEVKLLAELGVAVLLFLVGLKLDLGLVRSFGSVALMTGLGQVAFTSIIGFWLGLALGLDVVTSLYVAVALTFSSTIIIIKLLSDKREIDSLHGRIALGLLIVQDLVVVLAMIVLSAVEAGSRSDAAVVDIARIVLHAAAMLALVGLFMRYLAEPLVERVSRAPELLVCFAIAWAALFAALGDALGFSKELGGLLAGVALASTKLRESMAARLAPLRDFLLLFFFIALGAQLDLAQVGAQIPAAALLSAFVLIGNPLIVMAIMAAMGYRKRTGFLTGLTVAQISEFSLIFMAMGVSLGHVGGEALALVTLVGLITISASTYMILYSHTLYTWCEPWLGAFERKVPGRELDATPAQGGGYDVVLFGLGRFGGAIAQRLRGRGQRVLGVDFNPAAIKRWRAEGLDVIYGDASDPEFVAGLPLDSALWVVSAVPEHETGVVQDDPRAALVAALRALNYPGNIAVTAHSDKDWTRLGAHAPDLVLQPFQDAADQAVDLLLGQKPPRRYQIIAPEESQA